MVKRILSRSIWAEAFAKYKSVAFDSRKEKESGCKHLCVIEPQIIVATNWISEIINCFETYITWNRKFVDEFKEDNFPKVKTILFEGGLLTDNIPDASLLSSFTPYDKKLKEIVIIGRRGHRMRQGNAYFLREEFPEKLSDYSYLETDIYSSSPYGGTHYQGVFEGGPWGKGALETVDRYLFYFCPENTYHPLWSYGYLGENIFRAFKAKTVPIYIGCYDIEKYVPKDLFIDFRDFYEPGTYEEDGEVKNYSPLYSNTDYEKLAEFLENFPKEKYIEMTEKAYEWQEKRGLSNYNHFIEIIESLD